MRRKKEAVMPFEFSTDSNLPKIVKRRHAKFNKISGILDGNPQLLDLVHSDLCQLSTGGSLGRSGDYTSETIFRALIIHFLGNHSFRDTTIRIAESTFLQGFIRVLKRPVMDHSFLCRAFKCLQPETVKSLTEMLGSYGVEQGLVDPSVIRTDSTVVETDVHYPTDASLLDDCFQTIAGLIGKARQILPSCCDSRFHKKKAKRLRLFSSRYMSSKGNARKRKSKRDLKLLIQRVDVAVANAEAFCQVFVNSANTNLRKIALKLQGYLPAMKKVVQTAYRIHVKGEAVPASEKVFSIFESHTELIKRGRPRKPVEFGHMIWLSQADGRFITDYDVMEKKTPDAKLTESIIDRHAELFGKDPEVVAADKGYCPEKKLYKKLEERLDMLAIPRRTRDFSLPDMAFWMAFRAGVEGTISTLKRAFRLSRCMYRGFKSFTASIGMAVFTHNLSILTRHF